MCPAYVLIKLFNVAPTGQYAVRFIPRENGLHYVEVLFDGYHIPDSPFRIMVGKVDAADAGKVTAFGDGLHTGTTGECSRCGQNMSVVNV